MQTQNIGTCRVYRGFFSAKVPLPSTKLTRKSLSLCSEWYSRRWTFPYARNRDTAFSGLQQCGMYLTNSFTCTQTQSHENQPHLQSHQHHQTGTLQHKGHKFQQIRYSNNYYMRTCFYTCASCAGKRHSSSHFSKHDASYYILNTFSRV